MKRGGTIRVRGCLCGRSGCRGALVDVTPTDGWVQSVVIPGFQVEAEGEAAFAAYLAGWVDLTATRADWVWSWEFTGVAEPPGVVEISRWYVMRREEIYAKAALERALAERLAHRGKEPDYGASMRAAQTEDLMPKALGRVSDDGLGGEIDWPEVVRRAVTDEMGAGAAKVLLAAFRQGVAAGKRDGDDATPEGVPPGSVPVVVLG